MPKVTAAEILKIIPITRKTLWLWQKKYKFFPDPIKQLHPDGKGMVGYYPEWVKERCIKVYNLQKKGYTVPIINEILKEEEQTQSTKKVLIIDNQKKLSNLLKKIFIKNQYFVETAYDALDVGLKVSSFMPSIIILDGTIPGINCIDVCRRLKSDSKTRNIRVVIISDNLKHTDRAIMEAGAEILLKKPLDPENLLRECDRLITQRKGFNDPSVSPSLTF